MRAAIRTTACALLAALAPALALHRHRPLLTFALTLPTALLRDAAFAAWAALYTPSSLSLAHLTCTLATAAAPVFLGQLVQARRELTLRLAEITEAREQEQLLSAQAVLAKERAQLAREMHDAVSHQVSLIAVTAGALQVGSPDAEARATTTVRIHHRDGALRATVTNTAPTRPVLPLPGAHPGLVGLRQRAALLGGTVTGGPAADSGYELRLELTAGDSPWPTRIRIPFPAMHPPQKDGQPGPVPSSAVSPRVRTTRYLPSPGRPHRPRCAPEGPGATSASSCQPPFCVAVLE